MTFDQITPGIKDYSKSHNDRRISSMFYALWHKEPREVHMFVDLLLQELEGVGIEVKQILPCGVVKRH
ncbi:vacuolar protein sorting-associated protein 51 [Carex littledalei]|uniref:Vacuolar protein sorting-associated protein 51 n=1 Tax=Carex littledalei TaxID=544730 RepID=A0A833R0Y7_9POAL|nr:vacuolar protein sorting-associated protein 51 [Carex littledalei]